jgi:Tfp pilus assembly protein PilF
MKKIITSVSCLIVLFSAALFSQTQGKAKMRGIVYDEETGQPLPGVTVKPYCESVDAFHLPYPVTDKDGKWGVYFIRTGMWKLECEKIGYIPQSLSYRVVFDPGAIEKLIEVKLRKIKNLVVKEAIVSDMERADKLFAEKKYDQARALYEKLLAENPDVYILNKSIGNCYFAVEDYEKALESFIRVYDKQPDRVDILTAIAHAYNNSGKKEQAAEWYLKIPFDEIRDIDTAYNTGVFFYSSGKVAEAAKYFKKSVDIDKEFADGYYQLGMASVALNKSEEAVESLRKFLQLAPESPQAATAKSVIEVLTKK